MYRFFVRQNEKKIDSLVERWPLAEVRLYLHELSIDIIMIVFLRVFLVLRSTATASYHSENQKWKHLVSKGGRPYVALHQYWLRKEGTNEK